jgi:hypothetical protein
MHKINRKNQKKSKTKQKAWKAEQSGCSGQPTLGGMPHIIKNKK